jgi:hypothetical protein
MRGSEQIGLEASETIASIHFPQEAYMTGGLLRTVAFVTSLAALPASHAATAILIDASQFPFDPGQNPSASSPHLVPQSPGMFTDTFLFSLTSAPRDFTVQPLISSMALGSSPSAFVETALPPGSHFFSNATGTVGGLYAVTAEAGVPIPEPETYVAMAAGLILLGFIAHRRMRAGAAPLAAA